MSKYTIVCGEASAPCDSIVAARAVLETLPNGAYILYNEPETFEAEVFATFTSRVYNHADCAGKGFDTSRGSNKL